MESSLSRLLHGKVTLILNKRHITLSLVIII